VALTTNPLDDDALDRVHAQAMRVLAEVGTEVHSDAALDLLRAAGQRVEGTRVRWDPDFVMAQLALAPGAVTLTGRTGRAVNLGGGSGVRTPVGGPPFAHDRVRGRREGSLADHVELVRIAHAAEPLAVLQSGTVEAQDRDASSRHLAMDHSILRWSDKPYLLYGTSGEKTRDGIALAAIAAGGAEALAERPMVMGIVNPNSPLVWDGLMADMLMALAEAGQPVAITPFLLAGASAPVTLAAGLSLLAAETLAGVALAQLVRPGAPCVLGTFVSGVDMRTGGPSLGLPESVLATLAGAQLARRYGLPVRGGGGLCSAIPLDAQAATESAMSLWATALAGCDLVVHAAGWLEGGLVASYEKLALDLEVLRMFDRIAAGVSVDDESLAFDVIAEVGPGGLFLDQLHTLERFRAESFMSPLFPALAHPTWVKQGSRETPELATAQWQRLLDSYLDPGIDPGVEAELDDYVARRTRECEA